MNRFRKALAVILFVFSGRLLFAFEAADGIDFNIRFFDRRIYYVNTDPILVQITIANNSPRTFRFRLADERVFSVDFDIRTMANRPVEQADSLIRRRTQIQQVFFRDVALETGESFSFVEDLRNFANFTSPGSFRVRAMIYPELLRAGTSASEALVSNFLVLNIRPAAIPGPDGVPLELDVATGAVLVRQPLPPDEVVAYMLRARQESQWERFFLYLDLEAMLARDDIQRRRWHAENEAGRRRMVAEYRQTLQRAMIDGISMVPTSFEILRTVHTNTEGTVTVLARFRYSTFIELRRYTYFLERRDNIWMIVNYSVEGLGTTAITP